jgi:hypothetical protein
MMHSGQTTSTRPATAGQHDQIEADKDARRGVAPGPSRRQTLRWAAGGGVALTGAALAQFATTGNVAAREPGIVGSWIIGSTPPAGAGPSFKSLGTFMADGGYVNSELAFVTPPASALHNTTAHGGWVQTGHKTFLSTLMLLRRDAQNTLLGSIKVVGHIPLDRNGDAFDLVASVTILSATGEVIATETDRGAATRIRIESDHADHMQAD